MKKIFLLLGVLLVFGLVYSQSVNVRTEKRTKSITTNDVAGADTIRFLPSSSTTVWRMTLTDSCVLELTTLAQCKLDDELRIYITNTSGAGYLRLRTSQFSSPGADSSITITSLKGALINYRFNGTKMFQESKSVQ